MSAYGMRPTNECIGRVVKQFWADKQYPRHSEGAFLRLKDGRIFFVYSRFEGGSNDDSPCNLVGMYSSDEGETWTEPQVLIDARRDYGINNVMSVSLLQMNNGDIGMFYIVKQKPAVSRIMLSRSNDGGKTFYSHTECTLPDRPGYYVLNNERVIRLKSGRLIVPLAYHRGGYDSKAQRGFWDGRAYCFFLLSDDDGYTWHEGKDGVYPPFTDTKSGLQEPGVVQLDNGVLWAYFRTDQYCHYESYSFDDGETWTVPQASRFSGPASPMLIKKIDDVLYSIWNPIPIYNGRTGSVYSGRTPFVVAKCENGVWSEYKKLADDPNCGYCYPSLLSTTDGCMLTAWLFYGSSTFGDSLTIKKFRKDELK